MTRDANRPPASEWSALQAAIEGDVILPDSPDYESARKPSIARFHHIRQRLSCGAVRRAALRTRSRSRG
jgi:hypothetical protein